jgi:P-type Mg2+ transporter
MIEMAALDLEDVCRVVVATERGLTDEEAAHRLKKFGRNEVAHEHSPAWYVQLLRNFRNPFIVLLLALAVVSGLTDDLSGMTILIVMVLASVLLRFAQEFRATRSADKLKALVSTKATVIRWNHGAPSPREIPIEELVPGDVVQLAAGDMIPGDVRFLSTKDLFVSQAVLSGESLPVEKSEANTLAHYGAKKFLAYQNVSAFDLTNIGFFGTNVVSGTGAALIVATGQQTYFGAMAQAITGHRTKTNFDLGINKLTWLLLRFMLVLVPVVLLINGYTKGDWVEAFFFALSVAVGLTPELLPMIVTANLARGAVALAKQRVIVKRINSIQNFGAMEVLCTDKTGTLSQDRVILEKHIDIYGGDSNDVLQYAYLNSFYQTGLRNLLDRAVLDHAGIKPEAVSSISYRKIDEIPFDFGRRRMSVVLESEPGSRVLVTKGAVEELLPLCDHVRVVGLVKRFNHELIERARRVAHRLNTEGYRVLAVAYREFHDEGMPRYAKSDESHLTLSGFIAFFDPPKETTSEALAALQERGIKVKVLTGDNEIVTRNMCEWVDLKVDGAMLGAEIDELTDKELAVRCQRTTIFCKLTPMQKSRIIRALQSQGQTVGYLGDGINDAPALREADVGISVDSSVDVAKESADIILLEKDLMVLANGVMEGRRTFGNIIKYIKIAASSNFGNALTILGASVFMPFLPLLPIQILVQNLFCDFSQTTVPFDTVDAESTRLPRRWSIGGIGRFMLILGPVSSLFDLVTFDVLWRMVGAGTPEQIALFRSGWFMEGAVSQILIFHVLRTQKIPFVQSIASWPVLASTFLMAAGGFLLPSTPLGAWLGFLPVPWSYSYWLILIVGAYFLLSQVVKLLFIRWFGEWL